MLQVNHLTYQYPGNPAPTLKDISFSVGRGEVFGFLGPSGSGKSTTQKILYKLLTGFGGVVLFEGRPLDGWNRDFYERIGVCFELPNHYLKLSARENLQFFSAFYSKPVQDMDGWLDRVGLLPDAGKLVSDFSKGMKMRLNFVRSVLHNPDVLFLDEPTSGLDPINAAKVKNIIRELKGEGKTIFLTTHNMADADQLCDRVALLYSGEIKALDTPAALKYQFGERKVKVTLTGEREEKLLDLATLGQNDQFTEWLRGGRLATIHTQEATLEEVFIKLTGEGLA
jgi:fluoroquinolone transport system ATP-binding protein